MVRHCSGHGFESHTSMPVIFCIQNSGKVLLVHHANTHLCLSCVLLHPIAPKSPEPRGTTKFFGLAKLDYLCLSFCDVSDLLANVFVRDLEVSVNDRHSRTTLRAR